jgi:ATPase subunit of ABC transporter with duplicated ATPase domains
MVRRNNHLKMARYHQHLHELLEMDLSPLDYMMKMFPEFKEREQMRKVCAHFPVLRQLEKKSLSVLFLPILILTKISVVDPE